MRTARGQDFGSSHLLLILAVACGAACSSKTQADPLACGNGILELGEWCDDGNVRSGDGCSAQCQLEPARPTRCGDGVLESPEACDDGNAGNGDGCSTDCAIEEGWACRESPCTPLCGDGLRLALEGCDDGNSDIGDGCSRTCTVEPGWKCERGGCSPICGDRQIQSLEGCDDGNETPGDGCSVTCSVELGWRCTAGVCTPVCGDGIVAGFEECDDGNRTRHDGCAGNCLLEPGYLCGTQGCLRCTGVTYEGCLALTMTFPSRVGSIEMSSAPELVDTALGAPNGGRRWANLPVAGEYSTAEVRYLAFPMRENRLNIGQAAREGSLIFLFVDNELFRISFRFDQREPGAEETVRDFARRFGVHWTPVNSDGYFRVETDTLMIFGATSPAVGCFNREGPCIEFLRSNSPIWDGQAIR